MGAEELKAQAVAAFKAAADLVEGKDAPSAEDHDAFNQKMTEAQRFDGEYQKALEAEGQVKTLRDRLGEYLTATGHGEAALRPIKTTDHPAIAEARQDGSLKSMGEQFVSSDEYKGLVDSRNLLKQQFRVSTNPIEVKAAGDIINSNTGAGGQGLVTPEYLPGIVSLPQRPLTVRDLFSQATTNSDTLDYARQTAFESGANAVAQATAANGAGLTGGVKPQSSIAWERVQKPIATIATFMAATRQQLADAPQTRSLIDVQGRLMIQLAEEDQLMAGNGTAPNLRGLLNTTGVQTSDFSLVAGDNPNFRAIRNAMRLVRTGASRLVADAVVVHPTDSMEYDLATDAQRQYLISNPTASPAQTALWGLRRVESESVSAGTAVVGAYNAGATVYQREGITVYTTDSHADYFVRNLVAILFEERLGLAVIFPTAFVVVTLKAWA